MAIYFLVAFICGGLILLLRNKTANLVLRSAFLLTQLGVTAYAFLHPGITDSIYFNFDSIGIILAGVLSVLSIATFYHSYLHHKRHPISITNESIYYASLILLITAMTGAYFTNHMGVLWAWLEATTLSVSVLIYHERTATSLEATWKYVFICSIGISIAFIGILFLSIVATTEGSTNFILRRSDVSCEGHGYHMAENCFRSLIHRIQREAGHFSIAYRLRGCPYGCTNPHQRIHFNFINECWVLRNF